MSDEPVEDWRIAPRKTVRHPCVLIMGRARIPAKLLDVSKTGLRLTTKTCRNVGEVYELEVSYADSTFLFRIVTSWDYYLDDHFVAGAEVLFTEAADKARWLDLVEKLPAVGPDQTADDILELRIAGRLPTSRPVLFRDRERWVKGSFINISEGGSGALLTVKAQHPPQQMVRFKVRIDDEIFPFRAQTVWTRLHDGQYEVGVKFIQPAPEDV
jgi:hypothetical protein